MAERLLVGCAFALGVADSGVNLGRPFGFFAG
jgi:hypothetical protein